MARWHPRTRLDQHEVPYCIYTLSDLSDEPHEAEELYCSQRPYASPIVQNSTLSISILQRDCGFESSKK